MHVGNPGMTVKDTDNECRAPTKGDTRSCDAADGSPVEHCPDHAANPVVESYADCSTENL